MNINANLRVRYEMLDTTAQADAQPSTTSNQTFGDVTKLTQGTSYSEQISTLEHNFFVLDGSIAEFDTASEIAYFSSYKSNANGNFETNPKIDIQFNQLHSIAGLIFEFVDDYPLECRIKFKTEKGSTLNTTTTTTISSRTFMVYCPAENFKSVSIEFTKALPYRYVKINKLTFGVNIDWTEEHIIEGNLIEEIDLISDQLSINQLNLSVLDLDGSLDFGNEDGLHRYVQAGQKIIPYETVNGEEIYLGRYFVDTFTEESKLAKFTFIDYLGILDKKQFYKGDFYNGVTAQSIIDSIMSEANIENYIIEDDVANTLVYGTIKPCTCREALREVLFATGAVVDTTRGDYINIFTSGRSIESNIGRDIKISTKVVRRDYVSAVSVDYSNYELAEDVNEIVSGEYIAGDNLIIFDSPYINISADTGSIAEQGKYYCILHLDEDSQVSLTGKGYNENSLSVRWAVDMLAGGEIENEVSYSGTLLNAQTAKETARRLLNYHKMRLELDIQFLASGEQVKDWSIVKNADSKYNDYIAGFVSMTTNLTSGFVANAKLIGYYNTSNSKYFLGSELFTDDSFII